MATSPEAKTIDVQGLMRREYSSAKHYWALFVLLQFVSLGLAVYVIFLAAGVKLIFSGLASILLPIATFQIKRSADHRYGLGERLRKLVLLKEGLGRVPTQVEILEALADATSLMYVDSGPVEAYFSSSLPPGPKRLAHLVEESAYYTRRLASFTSQACSFLAVIGFCLAFGLLWLAIQANRLPNLSFAQNPLLANGEHLARVASTVFIFFLVGTFEALSKSFSSLAEVAQATFRKCNALRLQPTVSDLDVCLALGTYDCALAKAPPIPGMVHWLFKKRLHAAWTTEMKREP